MTFTNTGPYGPSGLLPSEAFAQRWRARRAERTRAIMGYGEWSLRVHEPQTGRLDFEKFPYQREPYMDTGELAEMVVEKGTQVGFSTAMLRWALWVAAEMSGTVMYVMPTQPDVWDFSDQRIKPVIDGSEFLQALMAYDDPNNKGLRKIGRGYVYFRGSKEAHGLDSVPAWGLVLDEYDELSQVNIPVAEERVGAAPNPMIRRIGVPTLDGIGIDREYQASDMRRWVVRCEACNHWQRITMKNVRHEETSPGRYRGWRVCKNCERDLDVRTGEWVAEYPEREVRGYHVPRLIVPGADMGRIVRTSKSDDPQVLENHYHRNLAEPYERADQRLSRAAIESAKRDGIEMADSYVGFKTVTMGIDQASSRGLNVRISEHLDDKVKRVLSLQIVDDDEPGDPQHRSALRKLAMLMEAFNVKMAAIDHAPDTRMANAFCAAFPGRAVKVALSDTLKVSIRIPKIDEPEQLVTVRRTIFMDATLDLIRLQRNLLPRSERHPLPEDYADQLRAPIRKKVQKPDGTYVFRYESSGADDWAFAELFDVVATEVWRLRWMEQVVLGEGQQETEQVPDQPTANFNDWEGRPWEEDYRPGGSAADERESTWDDEYRP